MGQDCCLFPRGSNAYPGSAVADHHTKQGGFCRDVRRGSLCHVCCRRRHHRQQTAAPAQLLPAAGRRPLLHAAGYASRWRRGPPGAGAGSGSHHAAGACCSPCLRHRCRASLPSPGPVEFNDAPASAVAADQRGPRARAYPPALAGDVRAGRREEQLQTLQKLGPGWRIVIHCSCVAFICVSRWWPLLTPSPARHSARLQHQLAGGL